MIKKISRERTYQLYKKFPSSFYISDQFTYPDLFETYVLTTASKSVRGHATNMAKATQQLYTVLQIPSLIFLGDTKVPWLSQNNAYPPVQRAMQFLGTEKLGTAFNGGLKVATKDVSAFFVHLFWLVRCNAALPIFYWMNEEQTILANLCQYGNIHLSTLTAAADAQLQAAIPGTNLYVYEGAYCQEAWGTTNKIGGRSLIV
jgi:hypothetical protein